jgi:hypothetical protein
MPHQKKNKKKAKNPSLPKWNLNKNDKLKATSKLLQKYNAPKQGIPGWIYHYGPSEKPYSTRAAWAKFKSMEQRGEIKRLPHHLYLYGGDVTEDRKKGIRWKLINQMQKTGVPHNEAIYGAKMWTSVERYRKTHPNYVSPFPVKDLLPRLHKGPLK